MNGNYSREKGSGLRPTVSVDSWPWMLSLFGVIVLFVILRPPLLLLWTYGLHPRVQSSEVGREETKRVQPMLLPAVPKSLSSTGIKHSPRDPEIAKKLDPLEREIFRGTNLERGNLSRIGLEWNPDLSDVAALHSRDMRDTDFFAHVAPDGTGPPDRAGKGIRRTFGTVAENIAKLSERPDLAEAFVNGWMNSPGHRANILDAERTDLGVGCAETKEGDSRSWMHCTQLFMNVYANLRQAFPDRVREGQDVEVEIVAENGKPQPENLRQVRLQTGAVVARAALRERKGAAVGTLHVSGPQGVYRLEVEIPDPGESGQYWVVPGPYVTVQCW